eukprot:g70318.t1
MRERATKYVLSHTLKLSNRDYILVQAPDRDPILSYEFANFSLTPTIMKSFDSHHYYAPVWRIVHAQTALPHDNLNNGTIHTFNRYQLHKVDFFKWDHRHHNESPYRINLSFREFFTWGDIAGPSQTILANNKYLGNSLRFWFNWREKRNPSRELLSTWTTRDRLAYFLGTNEDLPDRILAFLQPRASTDTWIMLVAQISSICPTSPTITRQPTYHSLTPGRGCHTEAPREHLHRQPSRNQQATKRLHLR